VSDVQVLVLGGGISGCLTACLLADRGISQHMGRAARLGEPFAWTRLRLEIGLRLTRGGADNHGTCFFANSGKLRQPQDIDQRGRAGQPHRQHRHQRLSARDHPRVFVAGQQFAGLGERCRSDIIEGGGFHGWRNDRSRGQKLSNTY